MLRFTMQWTRKLEIEIEIKVYHHGSFNLIHFKVYHIKISVITLLKWLWSSVFLMLKINVEMSSLAVQPQMSLLFGTTDTWCIWWQRVLLIIGGRNVKVISVSCNWPCVILLSFIKEIYDIFNQLCHQVEGRQQCS